MSLATQTTMTATVAYDLTAGGPVTRCFLYTSTPTEKELHTTASASRSAVTNSKQKVGGTAAADARSATRSVTDVMDDILYTYTGVRSWEVFSQVQKEGAGLRHQLQSGAAFEHAVVQPVVSRYLTEWTKKLRALQAERTCAIGASSSFASTANRKQSGRKKPSNNSNANNKKAPPTETVGDTSAVEKDLELNEGGSIEVGEEDGLLPLWDDIEPTPRCGPAVLHTLRGAVRTYYKALLHLVTLVEGFVGRWGHLSSNESKALHAAMAREKSAHVPADFLFSAFTELNATEEGLDNAVGELVKCDRMEVLRLNRNPGLTELNTLPPRCRVVMACGCRLRSFLNAPLNNSHAVNNPQVSYSSLTTLGLAYNQLRDIKFVALLPALTVLDASFNYITDIDAVVKNVTAHGTVVEVTFQGNPISLLDTYRTTVIRGCVCLERLDRVPITREERTLSLQKMQLHDRSDDTNDAAAAAAVEHVPSEAVALSRKTAKRKSATGKLMLPAVVGNFGHGGVSDVSGDRNARPRTSSARGQSTISATSQVALPSTTTNESTPLLSGVSDEVVLRTTVAASVELLVLRGLSTFEPVIQTHTVEELLPSSALVYQLAGMENLQSGAGEVSVTTAAATTNPSTIIPGASAVLSPLASPSPAQHGFSNRKNKSGNAAAASAGTNNNGGGRLGTSPGFRGNASSSGGTTAAALKRVAAAPPLYEVTSRVCIEGCWAGDRSDNAQATRADVSITSASSMPNAGVRVEFEVVLAGPQATSPQRNGNSTRLNANARRVSSASVARLRKKVATTGGGVVPSNSPANVVGCGTGTANNGAAITALREPYVLSGASCDGTAGRHNSLSDTGVYAAQLALTPNLVAALQAPLLLAVTVEDTYRFIEGPALKAVTEAGVGSTGGSGVHGNSASRCGAGSAARLTRDGSTSPPTSLSTSPLPEAVLLSAVALGPKEKKESVEAVDDTLVECHRHKIGVLRLNPFDLFSATNSTDIYTSNTISTSNYVDDASAFAKRVTPTSGGFPAVAPANAAAAASTTSTGGPSLPRSRVLFLHDIVMETDPQAIQTMQHELHQRQRQLHDALLAYNGVLEQCVELTTEAKGGVTDVAFESAVPPLVSGQISPRPGKRVQSSPPTTPFIPPQAAAAAVLGAPTPTPPKPPSHSSHVSISPQTSTHSLQPRSWLKEQQALVVRHAVRVIALQARLEELTAATLSADARLSIGRGPSPPPSATADAELDALRYRREAPAARKGRPQPPKSSRR